jgi:predicted Rossmann-fold nucleotide-binding protein
MAYVGRDLYLVQSSDAVIQVGGRMGSLHEFTSALEARKPVGVLLGSHGAADLIPQLMDILEPPVHSLVVYDDDPEKLVGKIIAILDKEYEDIQSSLKNGKEHWYMQKMGINRAG